ncbi:carboxypeptidase-like regulatory domain-containing protein [Sorangium sp. So ce1036]|uniref:carboxypeptidase-like regulatory domain-containing protein n=1 Tax=Sorangium sp. So ce1036 TaxID=3133328 RepID=UPI003F0CA2A9
MMRWTRYTALAVIASLGVAAAPAAQAQPAAPAPPAPAQPAAKAQAAAAQTAQTAPAQPAAKAQAAAAQTAQTAPAQPAAKAQAAAAQQDAKAAKQGAAPPNGAAAASPGTAADAGAPGALPPGHPQVGQELPAGHPPVGSSAPSPASRRTMEQLTGLFDAPEDTVQDDRGLPPGVLVVNVQDADGKPVPRAPLDLDIVHSSVAKGESRERVRRETDESGSFRFEGLTIGSGTSYGVSVTRDGATFSLPHFGLGAEAGKRAVLHVYQASPDVNDVLVGMRGLVYLQLRQDAVSVEQLYQVYNLGRVAWLPDATFALPPGAKAFNKSESLSDMRFEEAKGAAVSGGAEGTGATRVALRGTVSPGRHEGQFRFQVPLSGEERQTIRIELPPRVAQMQVMAEASKSMTLEVKGFPSARRTQNRDGKKLLITDKQLTRADGGWTTLEITLAGLPTPGVGRWIALLLAGATVLAGVAVNVVRRREGDRGPDEEERRELIEAREALLDEFVELERARRRGDVGPKTYERVRTALLDALARIEGMIESSRPAPKKGAGSRKADDAGKAGSATSTTP